MTSIHHNIAQIFGDYLLDTVGQAEDMGYQPLRDNLIRLDFRGDNELIRDIWRDLATFEQGLLNALRAGIKDYRFYVTEVQRANQSIIIDLSYYYDVYLPEDVMMNIYVHAGTNEARRLTQILPGQQKIMRSPVLWRDFVLKEWGNKYPLLRQLDPKSINWEALYQEIQRLSPQVFDDFTFKEAIRQNAIHLVSIMLLDPTIDPNDPGDSPSDNPYLRIPIKLATERNHLEILELLMLDPRVDPTLGNNIAVVVAAQQGYIKAYNRLLQDPRVNPAAQNNRAIIVAANGGHLQVVTELLRDPRVNPADQNNIAIIVAADHGHLQVVVELLRDPRVNPAVQNNTAIILAAGSGHLQVVAELLRDPRVNPADQNNAALGNSALNHHYEVAKLLFADPRVQQSISNLPFSTRMLMKALGYLI